MPPVTEPTSEARVEISADPDAAATGDTITITGTGFLPNEQVRISCEDSGFQGPIDLRDTSANDEGAVSVEVIIPPNDYVEAGESFYVRAWGTTNDTRAETLVYLTAGS